jgi:hypothetical protein
MTPRGACPSAREEVHGEDWAEPRVAIAVAKKVVNFILKFIFIFVFITCLKTQQVDFTVDSEKI